MAGTGSSSAQPTPTGESSPSANHDGTAAAPWLDETEMTVWRGFLESAGRVIGHLDASVKAELGMTFEDYEVLVHLSEVPDRRLRMTELSERLIHSRSRLTQRVDRLQQRGFVRREKCPQDRRGTYAVLTDAGFAVVEAFAPTHVADVRRHLIDRIEPSERAVVAAVLSRVAAAAR